MKRFHIFAVIALTLLFITACGDKQEEKSTRAERHQRTAVTYQHQGQFRAAMLEARNAIQLQPANAAGYIVLAQIYNQVGAFASTQNLLEAVVKDMPETGIELAEAYLATKKYRSALSLLNSHTASSDFERLRQARMQGIANIALGDNEGYENAVQDLQKIDGGGAEVTYLQASFEIAQGRSEAAAVILEKSVNESPEHIRSLILLGEISLYANQLENAEKHLTRALSISSPGDVMTIDRATILSHLTQVLIQQGRTSEAYAYQKLLADANPESQVVQQKFSDAMELYQQGKFAEAEILLKEIHEQFPNDKNTGMLLGLVQFKQGDDQEAIDLFDQFVDPETANSSVIQAAAIANFRANKVDEAVALLKTATENQPNDSLILATYGLALLDMDETSTEGALALEKSLALNPEQQRLRIALAKRHLAMGKGEQALAQLQKAYSEQPLDMVIQQTYFRALLAQGQVDQVKVDIADFKTTYPNSPRGFFIEGWFKFQQKDYKGAQAAFEKAASMPDNSEKSMAYGGLAQAYELDGQLQKAANTWQMALREDPALSGGYARWFEVMQKLNRTEDAVIFLNELEKETQAWQPSLSLAQLHFNQRRTDVAIQHADIAMERSNGIEVAKQVTANLYNQRGLELRSQKELQAARTSQLKALELYPDNVTFLANLIETELSENNVSEAQKILDQFTRTEENAAAHLFLQGIIYRVDEKPEAALKLFRQSWDEKPSDNSAEAIYTHYQKAGQIDQANKLVDEWIQKLPQSSRPVLIKAIDAQQAKNYEEAIGWYEKTIELAPNMAAAINNLAWIYYEQKDPRAMELGKRAYDLAPNSPSILDTYGWILVEQGQVAEGIQYLQRAASIAPDSQEIQGHLREAKSRL